MLKNIPAILSPELLKVLAEMGHSDRICIGDGNFPGASMAKAKNAIFLRADGHGVPEILDAILQVFPLDTYVEQPAILMEKMDCDKDLVIPVWDEYKNIIASTMTGALPAWAISTASSSTTRPRTATASCRPVRLPSTPTSSCRRALSSKLWKAWFPYWKRHCRYSWLWDWACCAAAVISSPGKALTH